MNAHLSGAECSNFFILFMVLPYTRVLYSVKVLLLTCLLFAFLGAGLATAQVLQFSPDDTRYAAALFTVAAQTAEDDVNTERTQLDEQFTPEDFGLEEVGTLPTSPFYFLKSARRGLQTTFTFNSKKKAELKLKFAAEKLLETQELAKREDIDEQEVRDSLASFRSELSRVEDRVERASVNDEEAQELSKKVIDSVVKFEKVLGGLEKDLPAEEFEQIKEAKDKAATTFAVVFDIVEEDVATTQLAEVFDEQEGSEFKDFKNIEVLREIEDKVPEESKDAIRSAKENALNRLQNELESFEAAKHAIFKEFVQDIG